jgi:hypothetical protein
MGPESVFVVPAVTAACAGVAGAFGALAAWTTRRQATREADQIVDQVLANLAQGNPLAELPAATATGTGPAAGSGGACQGRLTRHRDGRTTCHGGRDDCWGGTRFTHANRVDCTTLGHGCGTCDNAPTGVTRPGPAVVRPMRARAQACARGCGRAGEVWVAASGSLPTLVCARCSTAIVEGRTWRVGDDRRARGQHAPGIGAPADQVVTGPAAGVGGGAR